MDLLEDRHTVEVVYSGFDGLERLRSFRPEVVFCDIGLPGIDGCELAKAARAAPETRSAFMVALTGYALPEDVVKAREAGFDLRLKKPPRLEDVARLAETTPPGEAAPGQMN